jgi:Methyltransferase FkbM domain
VVVTLDTLFRSHPTDNALVKIDVEGAEGDVLAGGLEFLNGLSDCAIQLEVLHMPAEQIASIAKQWKMYVFSADSLRTVRLPGGEPELAARYIDSTRFYQNDAILLPLDKAHREHAG